MTEWCGPRRTERKRSLLSFRCFPLFSHLHNIANFRKAEVHVSGHSRLTHYPPKLPLGLTCRQTCSLSANMSGYLVHFHTVFINHFGWF